MDLPSLTISSVRQGLTAKEFSCRELFESIYADIEAHRETDNSFLILNREPALDAAATVDRKVASGAALGPLEGQPAAIKDVLATKALPTTAGSKILSGYRPPYDATAVAKLTAAGAIIVGKTNCDEFGMGTSGENSAYGPSRNPRDPSRVPGGSSSGSAVATARGHCTVAFGTDTGGSSRQPASFCGVVGFKPTYGRISRSGLLALASSLDTVGIFTRSVADVAAVLSVVAGHDPADATSAAEPVLDYTKGLEATSLAGTTIGLPVEYLGEGIDPEVKRTVRRAVTTLTDAGATVREVHLPHTRFGIAVYYIILPAEASANLARYDGIKYGFSSSEARDLLEVYRRSRAAFGPEVKRRIMLGTYVLSAGYRDRYYRKAQEVRTLIRRDFDMAFETVDCLLTPTTPTPAFGLGEKAADPLQLYLADVFTVGANLAGLPAISVPAAAGNGLPIGVQFIGRAFAEPTLLPVAAAFERVNRG